MSYVPQATYGGYPGAATHSPYLDTATITQQEKDATEALNGQANMQQKMLDHQYSTQLELIKAECTRNITMATNQFSQQPASMQAQATQYKLQMEMQQKMATLYSGAGATKGTKTTDTTAKTGTKTTK